MNLRIASDAPLSRALRMPAVAGIAWAAAAASTLHPAGAASLGGALWAIAALVVLLCVIPRRTASEGRRPSRSLLGAATALAFAAAAAASTHVGLAEPARTTAAELALDGGRLVVAEVIVTGKVERRATGDRAFDALAVRWRVGDAGTDGTSGTPQKADPLTLSVVLDGTQEAPGPDLRVGDRVLVRGNAAPPFPGDRPAFVIRVMTEPRVLRKAEGALAATGDLRAGLVHAAAGLAAPGRALIPGLAVGDTALVDAELDAAMKDASLSHLTAVSGANCALVVGLVYVLAGVLGLRRRGRTVLALIALGGFVLLVTPEPSVVRAGVMAAVAMISVLLGRTGVGLAVLSLTVALLLVADPWLSTSMGFALSAVATAALLTIAPPLAAGLRRWMPAPIALVIAVPLSAQLACGPLLVLLEPTVPLYGVVANILAAPAAPVTTVVGLLACLAGAVPPLQSGLVVVAWLPASWIAVVAKTTAALPGALLPWPDGLVGLIALLLVGAALAVLLTGHALPRSGGRLIHRGAAVIVAVTIGVAAGAAAVRTVAGPLTLPHDWSVLACDVGQGDAVLLRSAGAVALVDTGPDPVALGTCLDRAGIARVQLLVLTHFDLDHAGGAAAVAGRVDRVLHGPVDGPGSLRVLENLREGGAQTAEVSAGVTGRLGAAEWRVLWPRPSSRAFPPGNDASVVVDVAGEDVPSTLLLGDLSAAPQRALLADGMLRSAYQLVKVAHHGSADQEPGLYEALDPAVALVTVGADNTHGHPRKEILDPLRAAHVVVARTDTDGLIAVSRAADGLRVWRSSG